MNNDKINHTETQRVSVIMITISTYLTFDKYANNDFETITGSKLAAREKNFDLRKANQLSLNTEKTYYQVYSNKKMPITLSVQLARAEIKRVTTVKYLGMFIDDDMKWNTHINKLYTVLCRNVGIINRLNYFLSTNHLLLLYNSLFYHM